MSDPSNFDYEQWGSAVLKVVLCCNCNGVIFGTNPVLVAVKMGSGAGVVLRGQVDGLISAYADFVSPQFCSAKNHEGHDICLDNKA